MTGRKATSYQEGGTPEEQSRREFLANATLATGGIIGLVLTVPLVTSLVPQSLLSPETNRGGTWSDLPKHEFERIANNGDPVSIGFRFKYSDGYLAADPLRSVWGIKLTREQESGFRARRPDLYALESRTKYPVISASYVMFSPICPHLGCGYEWQAQLKRFICPCHGSEFGPQGDKLAGPALRGLDPLPFRDTSGVAQITWIQYKSDAPERIVVAYQ